MSRAGLFGSWKSERFGYRLTFTRIFMACVFMSLLTFNAVMYVREDYRFVIFGFEETWFYVCIVAELLIFTLLGVLASNSYCLYSLDNEGFQREAELNWQHRQELEKARALLTQYKKELEDGNHDMNSRTILEGMYKLLCQIYPHVTETHNRIRTIESTVGFLSGKIPDGSFKHSTRMKETIDAIHKVSCTILANVAELEDRVTNIRSGPNLGQVINNGSSVVSLTKEIQSLRNLIARFEQSEDGIKNVLAGFREMQSGTLKDYKQLAAGLSSFESEIVALRNLLSGVGGVREDLRDSIREAQNSRLNESVNITLFKGQIDQLLERTEILDSFRAMLHKYAALMESSRGDIVDFLKMDDMISQPVTVLNLGKDIRDALVRNGFDKVESLLIHDAPTIQQMTRLGPKRMQRLEAALKAYAPDLRFGIYHA